jgi:hypothetical protein
LGFASFCHLSNKTFIKQLKRTWRLFNVSFSFRHLSYKKTSSKQPTQTWWLLDVPFGEG